MTYQESLPILDTLYTQVPVMACKGLCTSVCGPIALSALEHTRLRRTTSLPTSGIQQPTCPLLRQGHCSVYAVRPLICRTWGAAEHMQCPYGCVPSRWLTIAEWQALMHANEELSQQVFPDKAARSMHTDAVVTRAQQVAADATGHQIIVDSAGLRAERRMG